MLSEFVCVATLCVAAFDPFGRGGITMELFQGRFAIVLKSLCVYVGVSVGSFCELATVLGLFAKNVALVPSKSL